MTSEHEHQQLPMFEAALNAGLRTPLNAVHHAFLCVLMTSAAIATDVVV